ncbi:MULTISPECIES: hypothetical protein [unclassified Microcoleus]|uniref:hypothetical protein n=1 Tax=unclassified Microcoleus TaxID=2642155 RepID=UPI002FCFDC43
MQVNVRLVRAVTWSSVASFALFLAVAPLAVFGGKDVPAAIVVAPGLVLFATQLVLLGYWLIHFHRSGQRREFWLCYCLPYIYSSYRSFALLRQRPDDAS